MFIIYINYLDLRKLYIYEGLNYGTVYKYQTEARLLQKMSEDPVGCLACAPLPMMRARLLARRFIWNFYKSSIGVVQLETHPLQFLLHSFLAVQWSDNA